MGGERLGLSVVVPKYQILWGNSTQQLGTMVGVVEGVGPEIVYWWRKPGALRIYLIFEDELFLTTPFLRMITGIIRLTYD